MTESARDEALRLAREAGFFPDISNDPNSPPSWWAAGHDPQFARLIALARVGWIEIDHAARLSARYIDDENFKERVKSMLAAAPKPEEGI
jgi:hypothetical protein